MYIFSDNLINDSSPSLIIRRRKAAGIVELEVEFLERDRA
jgi:hypothetical protein